MNGRPTHVVQLTPPGRGAVATILVAGPDGLPLVERSFRASSGRSVGDFPLGRVIHGRWGDEPGEELVVCRRSADEIEIHCHGGDAAVAEVHASLLAAGATSLSWRAWVMRAETDPLAAAARIALAGPATERTAAILLEQYQGALRREIDATVAHLRAGETVAAVRLLDDLLARSAYGVRLTVPFRVVLAGPPNVGKSSLVNALLGYERAIVYDAPGTTRDVVAAITSLDGWPVELADTAGLRSSDDALETAGVALSEAKARDADLLVLVFDATLPESAERVRLSAAWPNALVVLNKCDLLQHTVRHETESRANDSGNQRPLLTSATKGVGLKALEAAIVRRLVPSPSAPGAAVPFTVGLTTELAAARAELDRGREDRAMALLAALCRVD